MEAAPPSYDTATSRNHWSLTAPYIQSQDLVSACQVSKSWHQSFAPQLWGNPSQHIVNLFAADPWLGFRKFERIIQAQARLEVRQLTHTLRVPVDSESLYEEIYSYKWLFNMLTRLPRLQCLLVPNVSSFDHEALTTLRRAILPNYEQSETNSDGTLVPSTHMRLLDASNCRNVTSSGLLIAFDMFPSLMYLDLSGVPAASFAEIPSKMHQLLYLKVLNLRRVRLTDALLSVLAAGIGQRVRCLDIRENPTTEKSLLTLLQTCFMAEVDGTNPGQTLSGLPSDEPPSYERQRSPTAIQGLDFGESLLRALTSRHVNLLALEDTSDIGITHLRMSMKSINVRSLFAAFGCQNLQYLDIDCGAVEFGRQHNVLYTSPARLECLRIHHSLVTGATGNAPESPEASGLNELHDIIETRRKRIQDGKTNFQNITASLPALKTLVLTDIPMESSSSALPTRLIGLLRSCATNAALAKAQARLEQRGDRSQTNAAVEERRARALFPLENIILELAPKKVDLRNHMSKGWNYREDTKAVTEDKDSEALWSAATTDFSFFNSEHHGDEPNVRLDRTESLAKNTGGPLMSALKPHSAATSQSRIDVVTEIVAYRKASRKRYESALANGKDIEPSHEYWTGRVSLVRT